MHNCLVRPFPRFQQWINCTSGFQLVGNVLSIPPGEVLRKNPSHIDCLFLMNNQSLTSPPVSKRYGWCSIDSFLHASVNAPFYIIGNGLTLCLRTGCQNCSKHLAGHHVGVNVMFFEEYADSQLFQFTDGLQTLFRVSGKPGYGLYKDLIDSAFAAVRQHPLEVIPLGSRCSCDTLVGIYFCQLPPFVISYQVVIVYLLCRKAVELIL